MENLSYLDRIGAPGGYWFTFHLNHNVDKSDSLSLVTLFFFQYDSYGLPPLGPVPNGLSPLLEIWGKGKNRFPLLVLMSHPVTWVVTTPSNDVNGEDGTIQAGEYAKGDTATLFVYQDDGHVDVSWIRFLLFFRFSCYYMGGWRFQRSCCHGPNRTKM